MDVGADEYLNWGRTRLRVELKKRGLSPSGLKTELLARLEEYFKRQRANGGARHPGHNNNDNHSHHHHNNDKRSHQHHQQRSLTTAHISSSSAYASGQHQQPLLPKQHHSKQLLDLFHHQLQQQQQQNEAAALGRELPRKRSRKSQTPRRGLQPQGGSNDNTSSEGEGSDHTSGGGNSPHRSTSSPSSSSLPSGGGGYAGSSDLHLTNSSYNHLGNDYYQTSSYPHKKPRLGKHYSQHESDDNGGGSGEASPEGEQSSDTASSSGPKTMTALSGRAFKKESGQVQAPHAEVRSVETIVFGPGDQFHFTHRFWRGKLLRRRFDFCGTYSIVPVAGSASADGTAAAGSGSGDLQLDDLVALSCVLASATDAGEKDGAAAAKADENRLKERTEGKVILHWPSKLDAPELRDWQFDQSYSHLFLAATASPSSSSAGGAHSTAGGLRSSSSDASLQPGSTSPVMGTSTHGAGASGGLQTRKRPHFLYTKHSAVFVEDTC